MATTLGFKDYIDLPEWQPCAPSISTALVGGAICSDLRGDSSRNPYIYQLASVALLNKYNMLNDEWLSLTTPSLGGTFGAGAGMIFVPWLGPAGTLAAGCTTTSVILTTALPAAVGLNQLADKGDGTGYKIRIIGNAGAGSSGKTEEAFIIANSSGTTPTLTLDRTLTFTPASGDRYEFLSGSLIMFSAGALAATIIRRLDIATQFLSNITNTNYIATIATDMTLIALDEQYNPAALDPGEGMLVGAGTYNNAGLNCLTATASAAGTLTGEAAAGDYGVATNEYRNFMIRIVEDTGTPAATGQRRKITSHTAGASPIYTLAANWTTTPSNTAKYVIELPNELISWNGTTTVTYSYNYTADGTWSTAAALGTSGGTGMVATQWANPSAAHAAGAFVCPSFGITLDTPKNARHSYIYYFRGGAVGTADLFDLAGGANGAWTSAITYGGVGITFTTGACAVPDICTNSGKYTYISQTGTQRFLRFDALNLNLVPWAYLRYPQSTVVAGQKLALGIFVDGTTKLSFLYTITQSLATFFRVANQR